VIWTGSDDGIVHVTRDGGATWQNVTPPEVRAFTKISRIDASPHSDGAAYVTANRYQMDDRAPYIWKTSDFGKSWKRITTGIRGDDFAHAVREDPEHAGLLYAGTEHGVYASLDDGASWMSLSQNLPDVPVTDLVVKGKDVVIATHGRSFYVLDDVSPLRQMTAAVASSPLYLFKPSTAVRRLTPATIDYFLEKPVSDIRIDVLSPEGSAVRSLRVSATMKTAGYHRVTWDLRHEGAIVFPGIVLEGPSPVNGPWAVPGDYVVKIAADGRTTTQALRILPDPRLKDVTLDDLRAQNKLALQVRDAISAANAAVIRIRSVRESGASKALLEKLAPVESELYQVKNQSPKDKIAFPIRLNNRLSGLFANLERGDARPTRAYYKVFDELSNELDVQLQKLAAALANSNTGGELE
jgi:hypothetical protein